MSFFIFKDQKSFMQHFGQKPGVDATMLYKTLVAEEYIELERGIDNWIDARSNNYDALPAVTEIADACIDLIYVVAGLMHSLGLDPQALWDEVHRSNIDKIKHPCTACDGTGRLERDDDDFDSCRRCGGTGHIFEVRRREDGKVLKPSDWSPPELEPLVRQMMIDSEKGEVK